MNTIAHPTRRTQLLDMSTVLRHRSLFCSEYDECLEKAAAAGWKSWSCRKCPLASLQTAPHARAEEPAADLAMASLGGDDDRGAAWPEASDPHDGPLEIGASPQSIGPSFAESEELRQRWEGVYIG